MYTHLFDRSITKHALAQRGAIATLTVRTVGSIPRKPSN